MRIFQQQNQVVTAELFPDNPNKPISKLDKVLRQTPDADDVQGLLAVKKTSLMSRKIAPATPHPPAVKTKPFSIRQPIAARETKPEKAPIPAAEDYSEKSKEDAIKMFGNLALEVELARKAAIEQFANLALELDQAKEAINAQQPTQTKPHTEAIEQVANDKPPIAKEIATHNPPHDTGTKKVQTSHEALSNLLQALKAKDSSIKVPLHIPANQAEHCLQQALRSSRITMAQFKEILENLSHDNKWAKEALTNRRLNRYLQHQQVKPAARSWTLTDLLLKFINTASSTKEHIPRERLAKKAEPIAPAKIGTQPERPIDNKVIDVNASFKAAIKQEPESAKQPEISVQKNKPIESLRHSVPTPQGSLSTLLLAVQKKDAAFAIPANLPADQAETVLHKMLLNSTITSYDLKETLRDLSTDNPWAKDCLNNQRLLNYLNLKESRPADYARSISRLLVKHIKTLSIGKEQNTRKERPRLLRNTENQQQLLGNDFQEPIKQQPAKVEPPLNFSSYMKKHLANPPEHKPTAEKKTTPKTGSWLETRTDKRTSKEPFTKVQAKTLSGELFTAELINKVPDSVFKGYGWSEEAIQKMPEKKRKTPLSPQARKALRLKEHESDERGRYFGDGSKVKVELAKIYLPGDTEPTICVAKKIKTNRFSNDDILHEISLQTESGTAPKVYGMADTATKEGERQRIIFMEPAKGSDGKKVITRGRANRTPQDQFALSLNYATEVAKMHAKDIYHRDLKLENSMIDDDGNVQIIDFGLADKGKIKPSDSKLFEGPMYMAPERIQGTHYSEETTDMEKVDVFSLGIIIGKIFGNGKYGYLRWGSYAQPSENIIENGIYGLDITNNYVLALVRDMTQLNPKQRPALSEVIDRLQRLKNLDFIAQLSQKGSTKRQFEKNPFQKGECN